MTAAPHPPQILNLDRRLKLLSIMSAHWFERFKGRFEFPNNYTCVDIETNGTDTERHQICSIGHTVVRDSEVVETSEAYLNWPDFPDIDHVMFRQNLNDAERGLTSRGKPFHHTWDRLQAQGRPPLEVLQEYLDLFEAMEQRREVLVAHNGWRFDIEFFQAHFHNWLQIPFHFDPELVYDTGIAEKASQLDEYDDPLPLAGETLQQFSWRIGELRRRGVFWALDSHCDQHYGLFKKAHVDHGMAHSAGADSKVLAYLVEEHKKLAGVAKKIDVSSRDIQQVTVDDTQ